MGDSGGRSAAGDGVELRCPANPSRMFARLRGGEWSVADGNLIEVACRDCRGRGIDRVLHRYDVTGRLVETVTVPLDPPVRRTRSGMLAP